MVPVLVLLFVALRFILQGDLFYVLPCVILLLCFSVLLALRLPRLGKRKLSLVLFVRLFDLCLFGFSWFPLPLGVWEGLRFVILSFFLFCFFTTAKLDATGQHWLAKLSNYNCSISYRSGKRNVDADRLSKRQEYGTTIVFPEVLKSLRHLIMAETVQLSETISKSDEGESSGIPVEDDFSEDLLNGTGLSVKDWKKRPKHLTGTSSS